MILVSFAAIIRVVTQRFSPTKEALRDDPNNGCEGDYHDMGQFSIFRTNCAITFGTRAYMLRELIWVEGKMQTMTSVKTLYLTYWLV